MDIILANKVDQMSTGRHNILEISNDNSIPAPIEDRLCIFVEKSMESLLDSIDHTFQIGSPFMLDNYHSALFPSSGVLS